MLLLLFFQLYEAENPTQTSNCLKKSRTLLAHVTERPRETAYHLTGPPLCFPTIRLQAPHWFRALPAPRRCLINTHHGQKMALETASTTSSHHSISTEGGRGCFSFPQAPAKQPLASSWSQLSHVFRTEPVTWRWGVVC